MKFLRKLFLVVVVASVAFLPGQTFAKKQTLVYGTTEKVTDMDPASSYDFHTWEIFRGSPSRIP